MKDFDSALFDVLKVQPEEFAVSGMSPVFMWMGHHNYL